MVLDELRLAGFGFDGGEIWIGATASLVLDELRQLGRGREGPTAAGATARLAIAR